MKILAAVLGCILGAGALLLAMPEAALAGGRPVPECSVAPAADVPAPPIQPGTTEEEREYGRREADSPEVQEFQGGGVVGLVVLVLLVVLIVYLIDR
jgi:hypothetical protein